MKQTLFLIIFGLLSWGNLALVARAVGLPLPMVHPWIAWIVYCGGPPVAAGMALVAWHRARSWRRLEELRAIPDQGPGQYLARGAHSVRFTRRGPDGLERWSLRLFWLALIACWLWFPGTQLPRLMAWLP